jgi:hypothetical protein
MTIILATGCDALYSPRFTGIGENFFSSSHFLFMSMAERFTASHLRCGAELDTKPTKRETDRRK